MKNIYVLPTENPSRLRYSLSNQLVLIKESYSSNYGNEVNQHIYITNDEEIKVGDYFIESLGLPDSYLVHKLSKEWKDKESFYRRCTKVILTTDQELIADGVQDIYDEFLQWFIKNPNCKEVKVESWEPYADFNFDYKIIIPKEEPKQDKWDKLNKELDSALDLEFGLDKNIFDKITSLDESKESEELKQDYSGVHFRHCYQGEYEDGCKYGENNCPAKPLENPKQETLDEVAEKYAEGKSSNPTFRNTHIRDFKAGADWQSKQMYSEVDMKQFAFECVANFLSNNDNKVEIKLVDVIIDRLNNVFEKFKNKLYEKRNT